MLTPWCRVEAEDAIFDYLDGLIAGLVPPAACDLVEPQKATAQLPFAEQAADFGVLASYRQVFAVRAREAKQMVAFA